MSLLHDGTDLRLPTVRELPVLDEGARAVQRVHAGDGQDGDSGNVEPVSGSPSTGPAAMPEGSAYAEVWKLLEDVMEYGARCVQSSIACHEGKEWKVHQDHATEAYRRITKRAYKLGGMGR